MIKLNGVDLKTSKPSDLDARFLAATGCSTAEIDKVLGGGHHLAAQALRPFLEADALPGGKLAAEIAADPGALAVIRKLYADAPAAAPAKPDDK